MRTGLPAVHVEFVGFANPFEAERHVPALLVRLRKFERLPPVVVQVFAGLNARLRNPNALPQTGGRGLERGLDQPIGRLALIVRIRHPAAHKGAGLPFAAEVDRLARRSQMMQNRAEALHLDRLRKRIRCGEATARQCKRGTCDCPDYEFFHFRFSVFPCVLFCLFYCHPRLFHIMITPA